MILPQSLIDALFKMYDMAVFGPNNAYKANLEQIIQQTNMEQIISGVYGGDRDKAAAEFETIMNDYKDVKWEEAWNDMCDFLGI